jgi:hypothetical protein
MKSTEDEVLLEPFPVRGRRSYLPTIDIHVCPLLSRRVLDCHQRLRRSSTVIKPLSNISSSYTPYAEIVDKAYLQDESEYSLGDQELGLLDTITTSSRYDPISLASVAGDTIEFRKLKEELRNLNVITGMGAQQALSEILERRRKSVDARHRDDKELSSIKCFDSYVPTHRPSSISLRRIWNANGSMSCRGIVSAHSRNNEVPKVEGNC